SAACAVRRVITSPVQPGNTRRTCLGYQLTRDRKINGTRACWEKGATIRRRCRVGGVRPADMVKAELLERQIPSGEVRRPAEEASDNRRQPVHRQEPRAGAPSRVGHWLVRPSKGMSRAPTSALDV